MAQISRRAVLLGVVGVGLAACSKPPLSRASPRTTTQSQPDTQRNPRPGTLGRHPAALAAHRQAAEERAQGAARRGRGQGARQPPRASADAASTRPTSSSSNSRATGTRRATAGPGSFRSSTPGWPTASSQCAPSGRSTSRCSSPMDAMIGNTGAAPWVVNYVKHYRAHLEGTALVHEHPRHRLVRHRSVAGLHLQRSDLLRPGGHLPSGDARQADQAVPFGAAAAVLPLRLDPQRGQRPAGQTRPLDQDPLQGRRLFHGLQLRQEDEALSAQHAVGSTRAGRRHSGVDRQRARDQGEAALRQDLPRRGHEEPLHDIIKTEAGSTTSTAAAT